MATTTFIYPENPAEPDLARLKARRKLWLKLHLYLGLVLGPVFVIVGLTGSVIAFGSEIDHWLNTELFNIRQPDEITPARPLDELMAAARANIPTGGTPLYVAVPLKADEALSLLYATPSTVKDETDTIEVLVNPYTAQWIGQRVVSRADSFFAGSLISIIIQLHYNLLLGTPGTVLVGIIAAVLIESLLTGLIVWWPLTGKWRRALRFNRSASNLRFNFELHRVTGFYSAPILLMLLFSGIYMNLPESVRPLVELFSPAAGWPEHVHSLPAPPTAVPLTVGQAVAITNRRFPDGNLSGVVLPKDRGDTYVVRKRAPNEITQAYTHRQLWIDQFSGAIRAMTDPNAYTAGQRFLEWQYPLHSGEAFGLVGRIIVCISGIVPALLYVTGFIRWRQKQPAKRQRGT